MADEEAKKQSNGSSSKSSSGPGTMVDKLAAPIKKASKPMTDGIKRLSSTGEKPQNIEGSSQDSSSGTSADKEKLTSALKEMEAVISHPVKNITKQREKRKSKETIEPSDVVTKASEGKVVDKFLAAYWPHKKKIGPVAMHEDGQFYISESGVKFVGLLGTKFSWEGKDISAKKTKSMSSMVDNAIRITYNGDEGEPRSYFFTFLHRNDAYDKIDRLIQDQDQEASGEAGVPAVPPDNTLKKMDVFLKKKFSGVSVQEFYDIVWSEGSKTDKEPFYGPWLKASGKNEVKVGDWEYADDGEGFVGSWCGEKYTQKRIVTFKFTRTTHLYTGPPVADVKHTQYCRVEGNDKCVLMMTAETSGVPFGDCFNIEIRWVATRVGEKDLSLKAGVYINFKKSTMLEGKIRSAATEETKKSQTNLFENMQKTCSALTGAVANDEKEIEEVTEGGPLDKAIPLSFQDIYSRILLAFTAFFTILLRGRVADSLPRSSKATTNQEHLVDGINDATKKLEKILDLVNDSLAKTETFSKKGPIIKTEIQGVSNSLKKLVEQQEPHS